jgi:hypothetical protein
LPLQGPERSFLIASQRMRARNTALGSPDVQRGILEADVGPLQASKLRDAQAVRVPTRIIVLSRNPCWLFLADLMAQSQAWSGIPEAACPLACDIGQLDLQRGAITWPKRITLLTIAGGSTNVRALRSCKVRAEITR